MPDQDQRQGKEPAEREGDHHRASPVQHAKARIVAKQERIFVGERAERKHKGPAEQQEPIVALVREDGGDQDGGQRPQAHTDQLKCAYGRT